MPYVSQYPRQFTAFTKFLNLEVNGDPSTEETALYSWFDDLFTTCYLEAEQFCGQPLKQVSKTYQFYANAGRHGLESNHVWKYIPYYANTSVTALEWRENEFGTYAAFPVTDYAFQTEDFACYLIFRNKTNGQFRATLQTGYTDNTMPYAILQGIAEMAALIYKQSPDGGNWFGLSSVNSGGQGVTVSQALKENIEWQRHFRKFVIPAV